MTSKWLDDVEDKLLQEEVNYVEIMEKLKKIDSLLFKAMLEVDNQQLSDEISEEINGEK